MADPVTAVFETAELLEMILLDFNPLTMRFSCYTTSVDLERAAGMRQLLRCQRVSKGFKATIDSSPNLQMALFLKPAPLSKMDAGFNIGKYAGEGMHNPLLRKRIVAADFLGGYVKVEVYDKDASGPSLCDLRHHRWGYSRNQQCYILKGHTTKMSSRGQAMLLQQPHVDRTVVGLDFLRPTAPTRGRYEKTLLQQPTRLGELLRRFFVSESEETAVGGA
ncbi:hypothetical protein LTR85_004586 [Meristemomyces frigidus]|nr:hypothetical protein LTR85_004586 [Meristemomyces frigidus]